MNQKKDEILLESGTNELEVVIFELGAEAYAINVLKTREIITPMPVTKIPNSPDFVEGVIHLRGEIISVVDIGGVVGALPSENPANDKFIIAELNELRIAFRVHRINRIHRISWEQIEKPNEVAGGQQPYATGIIKLDDETLSVLIDVEKIIAEINPELAGTVDSLKVLGPRSRSEKKIVIAEDSAVLQALLIDTLKAAGYENVTAFQNGKDAWEYLESLTEHPEVPITDQVHLLITDIEMPQMDGHHLTSRVKQNKDLRDIPVIIFSSLITDTLRHKGEEVGAVSQISKPQLVHLIEEVDKYIL